MNLPFNWRTKVSLAIVLTVAVFSFALGLMVKGGGPEGEDGTGPSRSLAQRPAAQARANLHVRYVCPMMDVPPMEQGGKCPVCGMELVEVSGGGSDEGGAPSVAFTEREVAVAGIRVAPVERKAASAEVRLYGQIEYDPAHVTDVNISMPCIIQRVYVPRTGTEVDPGTALFDVYSPELLYAEEAFLDAVKQVPHFDPSRSSAVHEIEYSPQYERKRRDLQPQDEATRAADEALQRISFVRRKLGVMELPTSDVVTLLQRGAPLGFATFYALRKGIVIRQNAVEGTFVNTGTPIVSIADPFYVWAQLDAYESDYLWIKYKQTVRLKTDAYPGETFTGWVANIDPIFDVNKRTFKVGVIFSDPEQKLRPRMFVRGALESRLGAGDMARGEEGRDARPRRALQIDEGDTPLVIPATAPLITGKRAVVYVQVPGKQGGFEGREVVLGPRAKDYYLVRDGLEEGEMVVVNGAFKIDSSVQILARRSMMQLDVGGPTAILDSSAPRARSDKLIPPPRGVGETSPPTISVPAPTHTPYPDYLYDEEFDGPRTQPQQGELYRPGATMDDGAHEHRSPGEDH